MNLQDAGASAARTLNRLLSGDAVGFDARLQRRLGQSDGAELRYAHLLQQFATRVYSGDYQRAAQTMERPFPALGDISPREAAEKDGGMLSIQNFIAELEWHARHRGVGAFLQSCEDSWVREFTLQLDLLPIGWGFSDEEFEQLLAVPQGWLCAWRQQDLKLDDPIRERLRRLRRFHDALRLVVRPEEYAAAWRTVLNAESPIGQRSIWQAFKEDGDVALDRMEGHLWAVAE